MKNTCCLFLFLFAGTQLASAQEGLPKNPGEVTVGTRVKPFTAFWSYAGTQVHVIDDLGEFLESQTGDASRIGRFPKIDVTTVASIEFLDFSPSDISALTKAPSPYCEDPRKMCRLRKARVVFRKERKPLENVFLWVPSPSYVTDPEGRTFNLYEGDIKKLVFKQ